MLEIALLRRTNIFAITGRFDRAISCDIATRNFNPNSAGTFLRPDFIQQLLHLSQRNVLLLAGFAAIQMLADRLHLQAGHRAIQIRREQRFGLATCHGITSTRPAATRERATFIFVDFSSGASSPSSEPTSFT